MPSNTLVVDEYFAVLEVRRCISWRSGSLYYTIFFPIGSCVYLFCGVVWLVAIEIILYNIGKTLECIERLSSSLICSTSNKTIDHRQHQLEYLSKLGFILVCLAY